MAAVATAGAESDFCGFEYGDAVAGFGEEQRRGQTGVAGADDADVAVHRPFQHREVASEVASGGVVTVYMILFIRACFISFSDGHRQRAGDRRFFIGVRA